MTPMQLRSYLVIILFLHIFVGERSEAQLITIQAESLQSLQKCIQAPAQIAHVDNWFFEDQAWIWEDWSSMPGVSKQENCRILIDLKDQPPEDLAAHIVRVVKLDNKLAGSKEWKISPHKAPSHYLIQTPNNHNLVGIQHDEWLFCMPAKSLSVNEFEISNIASGFHSLPARKSVLVRLNFKRVPEPLIKMWLGKLNNKLGNILEESVGVSRWVLTLMFADLTKSIREFIRGHEFVQFDAGPLGTDVFKFAITLQPDKKHMNAYNWASNTKSSFSTLFTNDDVVIASTSFSSAKDAGEGQDELSFQEMMKEFDGIGQFLMFVADPKYATFINRMNERFRTLPKSDTELMSCVIAVSGGPEGDKPGFAFGYRNANLPAIVDFMEKELRNLAPNESISSKHDNSTGFYYYSSPFMFDTVLHLAWKEDLIIGGIDDSGRLAIQKIIKQYDGKLKKTPAVQLVYRPIYFDILSANSNIKRFREQSDHYPTLSLAKSLSRKREMLRYAVKNGHDAKITVSVSGGEYLKINFAFGRSVLDWWQAEFQMKQQPHSRPSRIATALDHKEWFSRTIGNELTTDTLLSLSDKQEKLIIERLISYLGSPRHFYSEYQARVYPDIVFLVQSSISGDKDWKRTFFQEILPSADFKKLQRIAMIYGTEVNHLFALDEIRRVRSDFYNSMRKTDDNRAKALSEVQNRLNKIIRLAPTYASAYLLRATVSRVQGNSRGAYQDVSLAVRHSKKYEKAKALFAKADLLLEMKHYMRAKNTYLEAIKNQNEHHSLLLSQEANLLNSVAWLMSTSSDPDVRDGKTAIGLATKACELTKWKSYMYLDTLAAAYADHANFEMAEKWQREAIKLAPETQSDDFQSRLDLYRLKKPFRENSQKNADARGN
ncbi:hypothetical protein Pan241w_26220 [Gimesia alba]|uniref:Tetratricopeptide repeat protein n=1 Tax=Gimesia alba TaxID=2527973 RepID=A0A517RF84_9PLAN|nr:hypothetical protein [Gimesia alba]QDT42537.1 hypothetical protein Pan241w_26220 [Gimesia alba]